MCWILHLHKDLESSCKKDLLRFLALNLGSCTEIHQMPETVANKISEDPVPRGCTSFNRQFHLRAQSWDYSARQKSKHLLKIYIQSIKHPSSNFSKSQWNCCSDGIELELQALSSHSSVLERGFTSCRRRLFPVPVGILSTLLRGGGMAYIQLHS